MSTRGAQLAQEGNGHAKSLHRHPLCGRFQITVEIDPQYTPGQGPLPCCGGSARRPSSTARRPSITVSTASSSRVKGIACRLFGVVDFETDRAEVMIVARCNEEAIVSSVCN
jgi:hypothetical protein